MMDWMEEFPAAITVCDRRGKVLAMNRAAGRVFGASGGRRLIGKSLLDCHPGPARALLEAMLVQPRLHTYTIQKGRVKKLIHQSPWYQRGRFAGYVELSLVLPRKLPHHVRSAVSSARGPRRGS
ncbi:MAG: PAS domain-containing protein [Elusimicrobiota bacterium]|jgi:PAS domain-containing protein